LNCQPDLIVLWLPHDANYLQPFWNFAEFHQNFALKAAKFAAMFSLSQVGMQVQGSPAVLPASCLA